MIRDFDGFKTIDLESLESLPRSEWPQFTVEGIKDGKPLQLTWIAGYFNKTGNRKYDSELDRLVTQYIEVPTMPDHEPRSISVSMIATRKFFDEGTVWDEDTDKCLLKYRFFNMKDPDKVSEELSPNDPNTIY